MVGGDTPLFGQIEKYRSTLQAQDGTCHFIFVCLTLRVKVCQNVCVCACLGGVWVYAHKENEKDVFNVQKGESDFLQFIECGHCDELVYNAGVVVLYA